MPAKRRRRDLPQSNDEVDSNTTDNSSTTATIQAVATRVSKRLKRGPTTTSINMNTMDEEMKEVGADDVDQAMREEESMSAQAEPTLSTMQSIIPYGLLKLPQSIASELASEYLLKREIRDLGVTCRWMLVSLNQCVIKEPISLEVAHRRLNRERIVAASHQVCQKTANLREVVARVPNLFIGRFKYLRFSPLSFKPGHIKQFSELNRFVDVRTLVFNVDCGIDPKLARLWKFPIELPPKLLDLIIERDGGLPPLDQFFLPSTLRSITWLSSNYYQSVDLTDMKLPESLIALVHLPSRPVKNLILPPNLLTLTFNSMININPIADLSLPHSITNLCINDWISASGSYHDLPFPRSLRRLAFSGKMMRDDFNLNEWTHLPVGCDNLEIALIGDRTPPPSLATGKPPPVHITIPSFIKQLRLWRQRKTHLQPAAIHLANATALTSAVFDQTDNIEWPNSSTSVLTSIKLIGPAERFFSVTSSLQLPYRLDSLPVALPLSLTSLDLSDVFYWWIFPSDPSGLVWSTILPRLRQINFPRSHDGPIDLETWRSDFNRQANALISMVQEWSRTLSNCTLEGLVYKRRSLTTEPPTPTFQRWKDGVVIDEFEPTPNEIEAMEELDRQSYDTVVDPLTLV